MGVRINTNIEAINAQRNLSATSLGFAKSVEKLGSGLRINRAADDAAGLGISEKLRAQIKGLNQAVRNAQDGISMIQTAEGALNEVHSMFQRMRELAVQASNDTLSDNDRTNINTELQQLKTEINSVASQTKFNGKGLLSGSLVTSLGGVTANDLIVNDSITNGGETAVATSIDVSGARSGETFTFTASGTTLTLTRGSDSVAQSLTAGAIAANGTQSLNFSSLGVKVTLASSAGMTAANVAAGITAAANDTILTAAGSGSANIHIGSQAADVLAVSFDKVDLGGAVGDSNIDDLATALTTYNVGVANRTSATSEALITNIDNAIDFVNTKRANLGAYQNRLEHTISNLGVASENLSASESRIRDVDLAAEMVAFTKSQILQQSGTSILAQANSAPQSILQLLR
jgi:flagellin